MSKYNIIDSTAIHSSDIDLLSINPYTQTWMDANIPYDMSSPRSSNARAEDSYKGLDNINYKYRYALFSQGARRVACI